MPTSKVTFKIATDLVPLCSEHLLPGVAQLTQEELKLLCGVTKAILIDRHATRYAAHFPVFNGGATVLIQPSNGEVESPNAPSDGEVTEATVFFARKGRPNRKDIRPWLVDVEDAPPGRPYQLTSRDYSEEAEEERANECARLLLEAGVENK